MRITEDCFKSNSIGFLRLLFAIFVLLTHCYLAGVGYEPLHGQCLFMTSTFITSLGGLGVLGFFFLSGLLLARSYEAAPSCGRYLWHRVLRIFPGYWGCLLFTALLLGPLLYYLQHGALDGYFAAGVNSPFSYLKRNSYLAVKQIGIWNLFENNPTPAVTNGSLWTLRIEFVCYLILASIALLIKRERQRPVLLGLILLCLCGAIAPQRLSQWSVPSTVVNFIAPFAPERYCGAFFFIGVLTYHNRDWIILNRWLALGSFTLTALSLGFSIAAPVLPFTFPYLLLWLAFRLPCTGYDRKIDLSYGIYLYAWPIQQSLVWAGAGGFGFEIFFALSLACTVPMAILSWYSIERPALRLKHVRLPTISLPKHPRLNWLSRQSARI